MYVITAIHVFCFRVHAGVSTNADHGAGRILSDPSSFSAGVALSLAQLGRYFRRSPPDALGAISHAKVRLLICIVVRSLAWGSDSAWSRCATTAFVSPILRGGPGSLWQLKLQVGYVHTLARMQEACFAGDRQVEPLILGAVGSQTIHNGESCNLYPVYYVHVGRTCPSEIYEICLFSNARRCPSQFKVSHIGVHVRRGRDMHTQYMTARDIPQEIHPVAWSLRLDIPGGGCAAVLQGRGQVYVVGALYLTVPYISYLVGCVWCRSCVLLRLGVTLPKYAASMCCTACRITVLRRLLASHCVPVCTCASFPFLCWFRWTTEVSPTRTWGPRRWSISRRGGRTTWCSSPRISPSASTPRYRSTRLRMRR